MGVFATTGVAAASFKRSEFPDSELTRSELGRGADGEECVPRQGLRRVLIVEDDLPLSRFLSRELRSKSFDADARPDAESAREMVATKTYDLLLLDLNLPSMDGIQFLKSVRRMGGTYCPVLVLTARTRTEDLVAAFDHGADDCLLKPFSFLELLARMRNLMRRADDGERPSQVRIESLLLNRAEHRVLRGDRRIELTPREFAILEYMMSHAGRPVSRASLMRDVWQTAFDPSTNIVDVYMKYVRDKIDGEGEPRLIHTVRGVGYVLREE